MVTYAMYLNPQLFIGQCLWLFPILPSYSHGWWHIAVTHRASRATHIHLYHLQYIAGGRHYFWILANNKQKLTRELNTYVIIILCHWHLNCRLCVFQSQSADSGDYKVMYGILLCCWLYICTTSTWNKNLGSFFDSVSTHPCSADTT